MEKWDDEKFNAFACEVFEYQRENNPIYSDYCSKKGINKVDSYLKIPAVPTDVFKRADLVCDPSHVAAFMTSGTTTGQRGVHYFPTLEYYRASMMRPFERYVMGKQTGMPMLMLVPPPELMPESSLSFMMGELAKRYTGHYDLPSKFYVSKREDGDVKDDEHEEDESDYYKTLKFDFDELIQDLNRAVAKNLPVLLMGTAFALVEFLAYAKQNWSLPKGSRLLETGGLKGKTREIKRDEMFALFKTSFRLPDAMMISEYSMTELSSQAYTDNLPDPYIEYETQPYGTPWQRSRYRVPPWVRVEVATPRYLKVQPPKADKPSRGLIRWYDLANFNSVIAVQTADVGEVYSDGSFTLLGRASKSEMRGCSITVEDILAAGRFI